MNASQASQVRWKIQEGMSQSDQVAIMQSKSAPASYQLGADLKVQAGVPRGRIQQFQGSSEKIYPGTGRDYWLYIPQQ